WEYALLLPLRKKFYHPIFFVARGQVSFLPLYIHFPQKHRNAAMRFYGLDTDRPFRLLFRPFRFPFVAPLLNPFRKRIDKWRPQPFSFYIFCEAAPKSLPIEWLNSLDWQLFYHFWSINEH